MTMLDRVFLHVLAAVAALFGVIDGALLGDGLEDRRHDGSEVRAAATGSSTGAVSATSMAENTQQHRRQWLHEHLPAARLLEVITVTSSPVATWLENGLAQAASQPSKPGALELTLNLDYGHASPSFLLLDEYSGASDESVGVFVRKDLPRDETAKFFKLFIDEGDGDGTRATFAEVLMEKEYKLSDVYDSNKVMDEKVMDAIADAEAAGTIWRPTHLENYGYWMSVCQKNIAVTGCEATTGAHLRGEASRAHSVVSVDNEAACSHKPDIGKAEVCFV